MTETKLTLPRLFTDKPANTFYFHQNQFISEDTAKSGEKVVFLTKDITAIRYEMKRIRGRYFYIGTHYKIELKTWPNDELKISFSSYYGFRKKAYNEIYGKLLNSLLMYYFQEKWESMIEELQRGEQYTFGDVALNAAGVSWDKQFLPWSSVAVKKYYRYFVVYDSNNAENHKSMHYATDWNAVVARRIIERMINKKEAF